MTPHEPPKETGGEPETKAEERRKTEAQDSRKKSLELVGDDPTGGFVTERGRAEPRRLELVFDSVPPGSIPPPSIPPNGPSIGDRSTESDHDELRGREGPRRRPVTHSSVANRVATSVLAGRVPFGSREAGMIRSLSRTLALTGLFTIAIGAICIAQWTLGRGTVAAIVFGILAVATGSWSLLAGWHFQRVGINDHDDAHQLVAAFGNLRSTFILKAIALFLALALSCFAFSIAASLITLL